MKNALWIKGYENKYKILPNGDIYSFVRNPKIGKLLSPRKSGSGYLMVTLLGEQKYIHQLVAEHYLINPNKRKYKLVIFKDGNPENVKISNLMWSDCDGRGKQRSKNEKKFLKSEGMVNTKISNKELHQIVRILKNKKDTNTQQLIAEKFGIHRITLYRLRKTKEFQKAFSEL